MQKLTYSASICLFITMLGISHLASGQVIIDGLEWKPNLSNTKDIEEKFEAKGMTKQEIYDRIFTFTKKQINPISDGLVHSSGDENVDSKFIWQNAEPVWSKRNKIVAFYITTDGDLDVTSHNRACDNCRTTDGELKYLIMVTCADNSYTITTVLSVIGGIHLSRCFLFKATDENGKVYPDHLKMHKRIGKEYKEIKDQLHTAIFFNDEL